MAGKIVTLLAALLMVTPELVAATPMVVPPGTVPTIKQGITNNCPKRTFGLVAQSTVGSLVSSTMYQAVVTPEDGGKPFVEITTCYFGGWFGAGCKWLKPGTATINKPGGWWTVQHSGYTSSSPNSDDITMNGDDCDGQVQHCTSGVTQTCFPDPVDPENPVITCILDNIVGCNQGQAPIIYAPAGKQTVPSKNALSDTQKALLT